MNCEDEDGSNQHDEAEGQRVGKQIRDDDGADDLAGDEKLEAPAGTVVRLRYESGPSIAAGRPGSPSTGSW